MKLFKHQLQSLKLLATRPVAFDASDPGTGKTAVHIMHYASRPARTRGRLMVFATKSLLTSAWKNDILRFAPTLRVVTAYAHNRKQAFDLPHDVLVINHDGVKDVLKQPAKWIKQYDHFILDESTCFPAGTLIDTPNGAIAIEMLRSGDPVYTSAGIELVSNTFTHYSDEIVQMELSNGQTITCTNDHPFATTIGWMEAGATRDLSLVLIDLHKLNEQRSDLLQPFLQQQSEMVTEIPGRESTYGSSLIRKIDGEAVVEQRGSMSTGNKSKIKSRSQSFWASTKTTWRQWKNQCLRTNDERDASTILGIQPDYSNNKIWQRWLPKRIQSGLWSTLQKMGVGSRWQFAHIAKTLRCEERYLADTIRVVRISSVQCTSPQLVYNLQVNGSHTYSIAGGILVHNCAKHHTSQRSRAFLKLVKTFKHRYCLSGTPMSNGACDIWHQIKLLDDGKRLGSTFTGFRNAACVPQQVGPQAHMIQWVDRPGIETTIYTMLRDILIRHRFEDCTDVPANHRYAVPFTLSPKHLKTYKQMESSSLLEIKDKTINAVNGAVLYNKLLQIAAGSVYNTDGSHTLIDSDRATLALDLVEERPHTIVFFHWRHQREQLVKEAIARKLSFAVYDGDTSEAQRTQIVEDYQAGKLRVLFAHPQSAGHGLTLTRGTATIWASPTHNLEHYLQGLKRIHRIGQSQRTETIVIVAEGTIDEKVWDVLQQKDVKQQDFLELLCAA
jgi:hypothetical protein